MVQSGPPHTNSGRDFAIVKKQLEKLINEGNPGAAKERGVVLCQQCSGDPHAWFLMSAIHAQLGEYADAEYCCLRIIGLAPGIPSVYFNRGIALMNLNRIEEAIECFRDALRFQPDFVEAHVNLGDALRVAQKFEQACRAYRDAARLRPEIPAVHTRLAVALKESNDLVGAELSLQKALQLDVKHIPAMLEFGRLKMQRGLHLEAITAFREALSVDATCQEAHEQIGHIEFSRGNIEAALKSYEKILELFPTDIRTRILVIRLLSSHRLLPRAETVCHQGLKSSPDNIPLLCELGKVMSEQGMKEEASRIFRRAKELDPANAEIEYLLSEFEENTDAHIARQNYIRKIFDGYADSFDHHLQGRLEYRTPELIFKALEETGVTSRQGLNIMDLGCGTGLCGPLFRNIAGRLVGVDLSSKMIEKAKNRKVYDELYEADIIEALGRAANAYDLVLAADVFVYVGDLAPVFAGCATTLREGGFFAFSIESVEAVKFVLRTSGRYGHSLFYVQKLAEEYGFDIPFVRESIIRKEGQQPIPGNVIILKKLPNSLQAK